MDWNLHFDGDDAESTFIFCPPPPRSQTFESNLPALTHLVGTYTPTILYAFTINYILGCGVLGVPYAIQQFGSITGGVLILVIVTFASYCTVMGVAECGEAIYLSKNKSNSLIVATVAARTYGSVVASPQPHSEPTSSSDTENNSYLWKASPSIFPNPTSPSSIPSIDLQDSSPMPPLISHPPQHYEVTELVELLLGKSHQRIYNCCLLGLMYVGCLAYSQVFNNSVVALLPFVGDDTPLLTKLLPPTLFSVIVIPLTLIDLEEQTQLQLFMFVARFVSIFSMIGGALVGLYCKSGDDSSNSISISNSNSNSDDSSNAFQSFGLMFSTSLFSQLFQHSVPGLVRPLNREKQPHVKKIFAASLTTTLVLYISLGAVCSMLFGRYTEKSVNLNFENFQPVGGAWAGIFSLLMKIVVAFPAIDTLSVFPLIATTLGNNLNSGLRFAQRVREGATLYHCWKMGVDVGLGSRSLPLYKIEVIRRRSKATTSFLFKLLAGVPPILLSLVVNDLSLSLQFSGLCGVYVAFVAPTLIMLKGGGGEVNMHRGIHSNRFVIWGILGFALFSFSVVLMQLLAALFYKK